MELGKDGGRNQSPGRMSAVVLCAAPIPPMTGFESKAWLVLPLPCAGFHPIALALNLMGLEVGTPCVFLDLELNRLPHLKAPPPIATNLLNFSS